MLVYLLVHIFIITIYINILFIVIIPLVLQPKIYYNYSYKEITFKQQELLLNSTISAKNMIFTTLTSFNDKEDIKFEKKLIVNLIYFKITNYKLSSLKDSYLAFITFYFILFFVLTLLFVFITVDILVELENFFSKDNILFFYSMLIFTIYSFSVYAIISLSSSFYQKNLKKKVSFYDKHFIFDFILNSELINFKEIYSAFNILEKEKNYFISAVLAGIFLIYVPLMYDKIYNVNVNIKSIDSKIKGFFYEISY